MRRTLSAATVAAAAFAAFIVFFTAPASAQTAAPTAPDPLALFSGASPAFRAELGRSLALAAQGKWRSAFDVLAAFDPKNADPYALAAETKIVLEGYIRSDMHRSFALKDLAEGDEIMALRASNEQGDLFAFDPQALEDAQASAKAPAPAVLMKELGDYFYDVQARWSGQWLLADEAIYQKSLEYYEKAYAGGAFDSGSLQNHAEILLRFDRAAEAEPLFAKAVVLDPKNAAAAYNYAICLLSIDKLGPALDQLDRAISLMPSERERFDAISTAARAAASGGDAAREEGYLVMAETLMPDDPSPGLLRHFIAIEQGNSAAASKAGDTLMQKYSASPGVIRALVSAWYKADKMADARVFLERTIASKTDEESLGALKLYLSILYVQGEPSEADRLKALDLLSQAEAHMQKVMPPGSDVFQAIGSVRTQIESLAKTAGPVAPQGDAAAPAAPPPAK